MLLAWNLVNKKKEFLAVAHCLRQFLKIFTSIQILTGKVKHFHHTIHYIHCKTRRAITSLCQFISTAATRMLCLLTNSKNKEKKDQVDATFVSIPAFETLIIRRIPRTFCDYFLAFDLEEFDSVAAFAMVVGLKTLFGLKAFLILNTAHAVPNACPAALSPSVVIDPACSPYLQ